MVAKLLVASVLEDPKVHRCQRVRAGLETRRHERDACSGAIENTVRDSRHRSLGEKPGGLPIPT